MDVFPRSTFRPLARVAVWLALLISAAMIHPEEGGQPRLGRTSGPNILIMVGDDHAAGLLGIDGDPRHATPRLDGLARQGVQFARAFCNAPICTASRQSFLTGRLPHALGVNHLSSPLPDDAVTLGDWLGGRGHDTAAIGKMHFNSRATHGFAERVDSPEWEAWLRQTFDKQADHRRRWRPFRTPAAAWLNAEGRSFGLPKAAIESSFQVERAAEFFGRHRDRSRANPFTLVIGFHEPHAPFRFPDDWPRHHRSSDFAAPVMTDADRRDQPEVFASLKPSEFQGVQASYFTSLEFLDHQVGRVLDALEKSGLAEDTIVVYLGDNGYLLGQHGRFEKHCLFDPAVRVPLILRWPSHLPANLRVDEMVELVDLVPTLLDLAGQPMPVGLHGSSLKSLALGTPGAQGRDVVVSEYLENEEAMARSSRYKLIVATGARRREDGYETSHPRTEPSERLYDLETDPGETVDLRGLPELEGVARQLRSRLLDRLRTTRGPRAPVPTGLSETDALRWCLVPRD